MPKTAVSMRKEFCRNSRGSSFRRKVLPAEGPWQKGGGEFYHINKMCVSEWSVTLFLSSKSHDCGLWAATHSESLLKLVSPSLRHSVSVPPYLPCLGVGPLSLPLLISCCSHWEETPSWVPWAHRIRGHFSSGLCLCGFLGEHMAFA